ncbi:formyltetrahydrofolate deformylase [Kutzneria kofuensis]
MSSTERRYVISLGCPDRTGIVAKIAGFLTEFGGWIVEAAYHTDPTTNWFFTRQEVLASSLPFDVRELSARFAGVARELGPRADWRVTDTGERKRAVILVSKEGHCLYDLLGRVASGELDVDVTSVIGNHKDLAGITEAHGIPFPPRSVPGRRPGEQGGGVRQLRQLVDGHQPHAIVLARFHAGPAERAVHGVGGPRGEHPPQFPAVLRRRAAVPPGPRPRREAGRRDLPLRDRRAGRGGPIIEQDVIRVSHSDSDRDMVRKGRDIEKIVLARGLRWHLEDRVLVHGNRTVVF